MIEDLSRRTKRVLLLSFDCAFVPVALFCAYVLRYDIMFPIEQVSSSWPVALTLILAAPFIFILARLPWIKLSAFDLRSALRIAVAAGLLGMTASLASYLSGVGSLRSIPVIFGVMFFAFSLLARVLAKQILLARRKIRVTTPVAIFGAGSAGTQLFSALGQNQEMQLICFIDDDPSYKRLLISGLRVHSRSELKKMVNADLIQKILIALPSINQTTIGQLVSELSSLNIEIQILPSCVDLISGKGKELRPVSLDSLLGRDKVDLDIPAITESYAGRVVLVTGAGGSIGSELCNQLLECRPKKIVLFEQSELALYNIEATLRPLVKARDISLVTRLGSVCDRTRVEDVLRQEDVEIILHAAAYKHVPLIEENEVQGAANNVLGTKTIAQAAIRHGVELFILVSTDKAVRSTNVMGATKRLAELVLQDLAVRSKFTRFSMVRFGNVLGSSGSVLPLFQKQIRLGGPVTVTHPDVTRYFMTIPEAARLVLLAGAFSQGGDVFMLDMGKPIKIIDIAKRMIEMSGASVKSPQNPDGIEIIITGLRPGEKLYEELLIDDNALRSTPHEKILRAEERKLSEIQIVRMINDLEKAIVTSDNTKVRDVLNRLVIGSEFTGINLRTTHNVAVDL